MSDIVFLKETKRIFRVHFKDGSFLDDETSKGTHEAVEQYLRVFVDITHIERLSYHAVYDVREEPRSIPTCGETRELADAIEALGAENERLRTHLRDVLSDADRSELDTLKARILARAALERKPE